MESTHQLETLVAEALAALEQGGEAALEAFCTAHPEHGAQLRQRVRRLSASGLIALVPEEIPGYRVLRRLGRGGMGEVLLAEQRDPIARLVAIKVVRAGTQSEQQLARFAVERQALARLEHPGIAHIFDAGTLADGRPYFVMEYVEGEPITEWCDARRLTLDRRLVLFGQVCDAVHHAHQHGVLHRDLKPQNILVRELDGEAQVKIIDFGLAKAVDPVEGARTLFTEAGQLLGTPEYMSPEQAVDSSSTDTRTDVYSLGVLLYELVTGVLPFDPAELRRAGWVAMIDCIREREVPPPSARVSTLGAAAVPLAERRGVSARALPSLLRGDLDWITAQATAKRREDRYASVSELAADVGRHLGGEAVLAGPPSRVYRIGRFVRRHRVAVAVAASFVTVLVVALVVIAALFFAARENLRRFDRLAGQDEVHRLIEAARDGLWPAVPATVPAMEAWLREARPQAAAAERTSFEIATLEARRTAGPLDEASRVLLAALVDLHEAQRSLGGEDGWVARVERRLESARTVRARSVDDRLGEWEAAIARVRARHGFELAVQVGLVPLGPDPASGLEEFGLLLDGGSEPQRAPGSSLARPQGGECLVLVLVPGGRFVAGAQRDDPAGTHYDALADINESPLLEGRLAPFLIGKYEVTQGVWRRVMGSNPSSWRLGDDHPVESVSRYDAVRFCRRLGLELPTEVQWEYAARGETPTAWWFGDDLERLDRHANVADQTWKLVFDAAQAESDPSPLDDGFAWHAPVGSFPANPFGLCDTIGNVWEWTSGVCYYVHVTGIDARGAFIAAEGSPDHGDRFVVRGGSHAGDRLHLTRVSQRTGEEAVLAKSTLGFRICRNLDP